MTNAGAKATGGWKADTPADDTVLGRFLFNLAASYEVPVVAAGGRTLRRDGVAVAALGGPDGLIGCATLLRPPWSGEGSEVVDAVEDLFGGGRGEGMLWSAWPVPDISRRGWKLSGHPTLVVRAPGRPLPPASDVRMEKVVDTETLSDYRQVALRCPTWGEPHPHRPDLFLDGAVLRTPLEMWVAYEDDQPVSIGTRFVESGIAHLVLGVTLPGACRRGHWEALVRARVNVDPGLPAAALTSDNCRPGFESMGFLPIIRLTLWRRGGDGAGWVPQ